MKISMIKITAVILICKGLGFLRESVLAYYYGTSYIADVYLMAAAVPAILFGWLTSLSVTYTPSYVECSIKKGTDKAKQFTDTTLTLTFLLAAAAFLAARLLKPQLSAIIFGNYEGEALRLAERFWDIAIWQVFLITPIAIITAYLNCNGLSVRGQAGTLCLNLLQILIIIFSGKTNDTDLLGFSVISGMAAQMVFLALQAGRHGYRYCVHLEWNRELLFSLKSMIPVFFSSMVSQLNYFIDRYFASSLPEGRVSALNYAFNLRQFVFMLFFTAVATLTYPRLSKLIAEGKTEQLQQLFVKIQSYIYLIFLPLIAGCLLLAKPAIRLIYQRGAFDGESVRLTQSVFMIYAAGMFTAAFRDLFQNFFFALKNNFANLLLGCAALLFNTGLDLLLIRRFGHNGLVLATISSTTLCAGIYLAMAGRYVRIPFHKELFYKSCLSAAVMAAVVCGIQMVFAHFPPDTFSCFLNLLISAAAGGSVYGVCLYLLGVRRGTRFYKRSEESFL